MKILSFLTIALFLLLSGMSPVWAQVGNPDSNPEENPESFPDSYPTDNDGIKTYVYTLNTGWNPLNFPGELVGITHSDGLYAKLQEDKVELNAIARFDAGRFDSIAFDDKGKAYGNHFNLVPGKGILIFVLEPAEIEVNIKSNTDIAQPLRAGWNFVGGTEQKKMAKNLMQDYNAAGKKVVNISKLENNYFKSIVKPEGTILGNDFELEHQKAYFFKLDN